MNNEEFIDLVVKIETENFDPNAFQNGEAILTGETYDGYFIQGEDEYQHLLSDQAMCL